MASPQRCSLNMLYQLAPCILPDRRQHMEPRLVVRPRDLSQETLVEKRRQAIQHARRCIGLCLTDRLGGFQRAATDEDAQPAEQPLLWRVEQVIAPRDCRTQRLLTRWQITRTSGEQRELLLQSCQKCARRQ